MDVTKAPPPGTPASRAATASPAGAGSQPSADPAAELAADRANIRPLDVPAALQILLAEIRAAFELTALGMPTETSASVEGPPQAARAILQSFLQAIPEEDSMDVPAWTAAVAQAEAALLAGLERGIAAISAWRNVPAPAVDAAKETQLLMVGALGDDALNPAWLRPEWAGFAPRLERFRRRRRFARRRLIDPDYPNGSLDDSDGK